MLLENKITLISSFTAFCLVIIKLIVWIITWSMAIIASWIDSALDMFISLINYFILKWSQKPSDEDHQFWHWKLQWFWAVIEWLIIFISWWLILYFALEKIIHWITFQKVDLSLLVILISFVITSILVKTISNAVKKTDNIVLKADLMHYKVDLLSNAWIFISLLIIKFTWLVIIDPIISIIIGIYIIIWSLNIIKQWIDMLMDKSIDKEKIEDIINIIENNSNKITSYHKLLTRQSGHNIFIQFHLVFISNISLFEAHEIADNIENIMIEKIPNAIVTIHLDPYDDSIIASQ